MNSTIISLAIGILLLILGITGCLLTLDRIREDAEKEKINQWEIKSYHYVIELQDEDWVEVRHTDGKIVGMVRCDTTTEIGKLFYNDNK